MSRVLVTGGTGTIGSAVVRRLLADPAYDVRVADRKDAPQWMREACEIRSGDLRDRAQAAAAMRDCRYAIHLAHPPRGAGELTALVERLALDSAVLQAAVDTEVERFVYVTRADLQPLGERLSEAAQAERSMELVLVSPPAGDVEGPAEAIVAALGECRDT